MPIWELSGSINRGKSPGAETISFVVGRSWYKRQFEEASGAAIAVISAEGSKASFEKSKPVATAEAIGRLLSCEKAYASRAYSWVGRREWVVRMNRAQGVVAQLTFVKVGGDRLSVD